MTITAKDATKTYDGTALTEGGFTATALETGDSHTFTVTMTEGSTITNIGTQANVIATVDGVAVTGTAAMAVGNYLVTIVDGTLTINPKAITIQADNASKTYGESDSTLTATISGLEDGDTLNYMVSRAAGENVGNYDIIVTLGSNPNYNVTATKGTFTINPKAVTVKADAKSKTYGENDPTLTATVTGLKDGDILNYSLSRSSGETVGRYFINMTLGDNPNYSVTTESEYLTINPAVITITADDKSSKYGDEIAMLTYQISGGYLEGDDLEIELHTEADSTKPIGEYDITITWNWNVNYNATLAKGKYTITKADVNISASGFGGEYDGKAHSITVDAGASDAVIYYSTETELTAENYLSAGSTVAPTRTNVGTTKVYFFVKADNYEPTPVSGSKDITITAKTLTVVAASQEKTYGKADPELTYVVSGMVDGEAESTVLSGSLTRDAGENVGNYPIIQGTLKSNENYIISFTGANLFIAKAKVDDQVVSELVEIPSLGISGKTIELKDYLVDGATLKGSTKTGVLADQITVGGLTGSNLAFSVTESGSGNTGSVVLTISSPNYQDYRLTFTVLSKKKTTEVVLDVNGVTSSVQDIMADDLSKYTDEQPEANVEVHMIVKLENPEDVLATVLSNIETAIDRAFRGVAASELKREYLDITVNKSVNGGTPVEVTDVNRVIEIEVTFDLMGKYNPILFREHFGNVTQFRRLDSRPTGSYVDGTFYVGVNKIYIYSRYFSTYSIAYTTVATHLVTFDNAIGGINQVLVGTGSTLSRPTNPDRSGYSFTGWYKDGEAWDFSAVVSSDMTLTAGWSKNENTATPTPDSVVVIAPKTEGMWEDPYLIILMMLLAASMGCALCGKRRKEE